MEKLEKKESKYTPEILLDADKHILSFKGKSYPENTFEFYRPVFDWIKEYFSKKQDEKTVINFDIIYFNSSTSKVLFDMFDMFEEVSQYNEIEINWIYDVGNETSEEIGEDFKEEFPNLKINLVGK